MVAVVVGVFLLVGIERLNLLGEQTVLSMRKGQICLKFAFEVVFPSSRRENILSLLFSSYYLNVSLLCAW